MDKKKMQAISIAVAEYIKEEEAAMAAALIAARQKAMAPSRPARSIQAAGSSPGQWAASGRLAQANQRTMMQMRAFR